MQLSLEQKRLVNGWQKGFPLTPRPYAKIAAELEMTETNVIAMLKELRNAGVLSRVGAVVQPNTVGASSLVAMAIPKDQLDAVAQIVCNEPCVNHNYERENQLNLWFVVTATNSVELDAVLARIESKTGFETLKLPLEKAFHIDLGFNI